MGLIRVLIFFLVIWLAWRMFRNYQVKMERAREQKSRITREIMVKCDYCDVHIPKQEALSDNEKWFCNREHMNKFLDAE